MFIPMEASATHPIPAEGPSKEDRGDFHGLSVFLANHTHGRARVRISRGDDFRMIAIPRNESWTEA